MQTTREKMGVEFNSHTSEKELVTFIDDIRKQPALKEELVSLLDERHPVFNNRNAYEVIKLKGYILASFSMTGAPDAALPFLLDELENGRNAYIVAGAARGLRGAAQPDEQFVPYLLQSLVNMRYKDESVFLDAYEPDWQSITFSSARQEITTTLQWMKGYAKSVLRDLRAYLENPRYYSIAIKEEIEKTIEIIASDNSTLEQSCCSIKATHPVDSPKNVKHDEIIHVKLENQWNQSATFETIFKGKPSVVAFFYTRCMNPNKCSLTINKLGFLQKRLEALGITEQVNVTAMTYDPAYDTPEEMYRFGHNRGMQFHKNAHMLRVQDQAYEKIQQYFELGVSYNASVVSQHRLELYILDENGRVDSSFVRLQWDVEEVVEYLQKLLNQSGWQKGWKSVQSVVTNVLFPILIAFFPKCPMCWAAYMSAFGVAGLQQIPYSPWLVPLLALGIGVNLVFLYRGVKARHGYTPFFISCLGALLLLVPGYQMEIDLFLYAGVALLFVGAMLNSLPYKLYQKLPKWDPFKYIRKLFSSQMKPAH